MSNNFFTQKYVIQTVDPVHIGTGGMRLGRVDNSIVREPGTKLPKIPGTSLSGTLRHYAAYRYNKKQCAKQKEHCGQTTCPICYTFGWLKGNKSYGGVANIGDTRILFFPVYSMAGPIWVTSLSTLNDFGINGQNVSDDKVQMSSGLSSYKHLNLGWLMVEKERELNLPDLPFILPDIVKNRIVLVSDKFFSQIVNSNLEVRTSVAINTDTGTAEDGALFTYEAIPRATYMWFELVVDDYREQFPNYNRLLQWEKIITDSTHDNKDALEILKKADLPVSENKFNASRDTILDWIKEESIYKTKTTEIDTKKIINDGLDWLEHLGVGGMGTRGFGRIRKVPEVETIG